MMKTIIDETDLKNSSAYLPVEQAPKFEIYIAEYHSYYFDCPICKTRHENVSRTPLDKLHCDNCKSEFTKEGLVLFNSITNLRYFSF